MGDITAERQDIETFAEKLVDDTTAEMRGAHIGDRERVESGITPRTTWFAGAIVPVDPTSDISETIESRVSPSTIGLIGQVEANGEREFVLDVGISFAVYYRVLPLPDTYTASDGEDDELPIVFKKREVGPVHQTVTLPDPQSSEFERVAGEAEAEIERVVLKNYRKVREEILNDPVLPGPADEGEIEELYDQDFSDVAEFEEAAKNARFTGFERYAPNPSISVDITAVDHAPDGSRATFRIDLENTTDIDPEANITHIDHGLYEAEIALRSGDGGCIAPIKFEELPNNFRYNPEIPGHGYNCTVAPLEEEDGIRTVTVPVWPQPYFRHRQLSGSADPTFEELASEPVPVLQALVSKMCDWGAEQWDPVLDRQLADTEYGPGDLTRSDTRTGYDSTTDLLSDVFDPDIGITLELPAIAEHSGSDSPETQLERALNSIQEYMDEIDRFVDGIDLIERNPTVQELFKQTNEVFQRKVQPVSEDGEPDYESWRPFQIVYIVTQLPDIVAGDVEFDGHIEPEIDNRDTVSLLHFPTGGGKTEAYLALVVFAALYDRRHGKEFGITAMMRFPLRLLSLQQFQRVVEVLVHADEIRKEQNYGGDPLSAGYFSGATKNRTAQIISSEYGRRLASRTNNNYPNFPTNKDQWEANQDALNWLAIDWDADELDVIDHEDYRMVENCPLCGADIKTKFNPQSARIEHHCTAPDSECQRELMHVYVTDQDIYRHVPTMLLGTQDKLAAIGYNYKSRTLAGHVESYCPQHGYSPTETCVMSRFCAVDGEGEVGSDSNDLEDVVVTRPAPTLTIQDELHLINEDLGTFESHYYAAYEKHLEWACKERELQYLPPKKLAATATIQKYKNQIEHLYQQDAILFPARGPSYRKTFYARRDYDKTQRYYIGVVPWNRSQINSIMLLLYRHQAKLKQYLEDPGSGLADFDFENLDDPDVFENLVTHYLTMVSYVISRAEGGRVYKSADNQVNKNLRNDGLDVVDRAQITGGTDFREIQDLLNDFEQLGESPEYTHTDIDELIVATKSISHGVDLDTLNWMVFFNAPPQMSEYIQASSRVGRKYPGIVLDVFDPIKIRDRSHFHYFKKYHEYQDRLVQPVPLNRWSKFSIEHSLPGILMSLLYIRYYDDMLEAADDDMYLGNNPSPSDISRLREMGLLQDQTLIDDLMEIYGEHPDTGRCPFEDEIREMVRKTFAVIESDDDIDSVVDAIPGHFMLSLREVDEQIPIFTGDPEGVLEVI